MVPIKCAKEKICALIVTYNRKDLLVECLTALQNQTRSLDAIILVDNASTDGTAQLLFDLGYLPQAVVTSDQRVELQSAIDLFVGDIKTKLRYIRLPENEGGAGGFHEGIKYGYENGYDWVWIMDDDTIPTPDALENLLDIPETVMTPGFICSNVLWQDDSPHLMNIPDVKPFVGSVPFSKYLTQYGLVCINSCSFVSALVSRNAICSAGLPVKEFFIWGDDQEYTRRIVRQGYLGILNPKSVVLHKTVDNYCADIKSDSVKNLWKHRYGIRNKVFILRLEKKWYSLPYILFYLIADIRSAAQRDSGKMVFLRAIARSYYDGLVFSPVVVDGMDQ